MIRPANVETRLAFGWDERQAFQRGQMDERPLPEAEEAEAAALLDEFDVLSESDDDADTDASAGHRITSR